MEPTVLHPDRPIHDPGRSDSTSPRGAIRRALLLVGAVVALAGCGTPEASGDGVATYFEALAQAYAADDVYAVLDFYAPTARLQNRTSEFGEAAVAVSDLLRSSRGGDLSRRHLDVYISEGGALALIRRSVADNLEAVVTDLGGAGAITQETIFVAVGTLARSAQSSPEVIADYNDLYRRFALAWSSTESEAIADLYSPQAAVDFGLHGEVSVGSTAISRSRATTTETWETIGIAAIPGVAGGSGTIEGSALYLDPTGYGHDPLRAVAIFDVEQSDGCVRRVGINWTLGPDGTITEEHRYHDVHSYRECAGALPAGWWTGLDPPGPRDEIVTGAITLNGRSVNIHNGTPHLQSLLEWGLERLKAAGLAEPRIGSVTFEPSRRCGGLAGRVVDTESSRDLFMCIYEDDLCVDDDECLVFSRSARFGMLHELAHAWMIDSVDDPTRSQVLRLSGREEWNDLDASWVDRGVEYAAEVIAWGLVDVDLALVRLGNPPCREVLTAYETLTGVPPLRGNKVCDE